MPGLEEQVSKVYSDLIELFFAFGELSARCKTDELDLATQFLDKAPNVFYLYGLLSGSIADGISGGTGTVINLLERKHKPDFSKCNDVQLREKIARTTEAIEAYCAKQRLPVYNSDLRSLLRMAMQKDISAS